MNTIRKRIHEAVSIVLLLSMSCMFMGCPSDSDSDRDSNSDPDSNFSELAATLQKYKWMSGDNPEFNEYDTWLEFTDDVFVYYFVSDTEGVLRQHHKWIDSYREGSQGHDIYNTYFNYKVNGNTVTIRFIDSYAPNVTFTYDGSNLTSQDGDVLMAVTPSSGDWAQVKALFPQTGTTGECTYTYDPRTKVMVISGDGAMGDYVAGKQPWAAFPMEEVTIEDGVTTIGNHAFYNIYTLQKVWISSKSNLRSIGVEAFAKSPITSITIPSKVEIIKESAFSGCSKLGLIDFSESTSLKTIENYAFSGVEKWKKTNTGNYSGKQYYYKTLEVPATVESMGMVAFNGDIEEIVIGKNMKQMAGFSISTSVNNGKMYVNRGTPPTVNSSVLGERESSWTLYVPKGCKSAYQKDEVWKKFYKIIEDESLEKGDDYTGGNGDDNPSSGDNTEIKIDATNFPDVNFRNYLLSQNYGKDGVLTDAEITKITKIEVSSSDVVNLKGIEFFTKLKSLYCDRNKLSSLDLSKNITLEDLRCSNNRLSVLNVSNNTALKVLYCSGNYLKSLETTKNAALKILYCHDNWLSFLDLSKNYALEELWCSNNELTTLDMSKCVALDLLYCERNKLSYLNISENMLLTKLLCSNNQLKSLDISKSTILNILYCGYNELETLDVSKNTKLRDLICDYNQLKSLDASKNTELLTLFCDNNQLTSLKVSQDGVLKKLYCHHNKLRDNSMDDLISSLPQNSSTGKVFYLINNLKSEDFNVCTKAQVIAAKAKGWTPMYFKESEWVEYEGI